MVSKILFIFLFSATISANEYLVQISNKEGDKLSYAVKFSKKENSINQKRVGSLASKEIKLRLEKLLKAKTSSSKCRAGQFRVIKNAKSRKSLKAYRGCLDGKKETKLRLFIVKALRYAL